MKRFNNILMIALVTIFFFACAEEEVEPNGFEKPITVTLVDLAETKDIGDLSVGNKGKVPLFDGKWVQIENVQFKDPNAKYNGTDSKAKGSRMLVDKKGNEVIVFTDPDKSFSNEQVAQGSGTFVGYVSFYGSKTQLIMRSVEEATAQMTNPRF